MSDLNNLPELDSYGPESFGVGTPAQQPAARAKNNNTMRNLLFVCGGCSSVLVLACLCCVGLAYIGSTQPGTSVQAWGSYVELEFYFVAKDGATCEFSQALQFTQALENSGVQLSNFTWIEGDEPDTFIGNASLFTDGQTQTWSAQFYTTEGGRFPLNECIDRIEVIEGFDPPITLTTPEPNATTTPQ